MIYERGFIHCDPHPGNILIKEKGKNDVELVLLDHGLYQVKFQIETTLFINKFLLNFQTLTDDFRIEYSKLWISLMKSDIEGIKNHANHLGVGHLYGLLATMVTSRSWEAVSGGISKKAFDQSEVSKQSTIN